MNKMNQLALALSVLALVACSKKADQAVEAINAAPAITPQKNNPPTAPATVKWAGPGTLQMTGMPETTCASVTAELLEDDNGFDMQKFSYDCSGTSANFDAIRLDLRAGELYQGAEKVGTKQNNVVAFELHDPSGANIAFQFKHVNDTIELQHSLKANGFEQKLTATLKK